MTLEELAKQKLEADASTTQIQEVMSQLMDQLKGPIPLSVGKSIINDIWGSGVDAMKIIARLSSSFPDENRSVIRHAQLPNEFVSSAYSFNTKSAVFMDYAFTFIGETLPKVVEKLSGYPSDDVLGVEVALSFRRESLRFIEAIRYGDFHQHQVTEMDKWGDFQSTYMSTGVGDGDYMFISDFMPQMTEVGKHVVAERERPNVEDGYMTLSNVTFDSDRELCSIKLAYMYCEYLETLLNLE